MNKKISKGFVNVNQGQVHYRISGEGPPIILLHDSPRSSILHIPLLNHFSSEFSTIAIDTPGYGNSTALKKNNQLDFQEKGIKLIDLKGKNNINNELYGFYNPF